MANLLGCTMYVLLILNVGSYVARSESSVEKLSHTARMLKAPMSKSKKSLPPWKLIWRDEFKGAAVDTTKWSYQLSNGVQYGPYMMGWGNNEWQWYTSDPANIRVTGGRLLIRPKRWGDDVLLNQTLLEQRLPDCYNVCKERCDSTGSNPPWLGECIWSCSATRFGCRYTSARVRTYKKFSVGPVGNNSSVRIVARMKLPKGTGLWPAFWLLPEDGATDECSGCGTYGGWPASGEIDIMEAANDMTKVFGTVHFNQYSNWTYISAGKEVNTSASTGWHNYEIVWSKNSMQWFYDGVEFGRTYSRNAMRDGWFTEGTEKSAPFNKKFHILINLALGGGFVEGDLGRSVTAEDLDATLRQPPSTISYSVDFVRAYVR